MTLPTQPTFDFALSGISGDVSLGKSGPRIQNVNGSVGFTTVSGQPGNIIVGTLLAYAAGIGTTAAAYPVDVYGNIHIGNTASSTSGIVFPDGTFQGTAAFYTPPGGSNGSVQFNEGNLFAANSLFTFDNSNIRLGVGTNRPVSTLDLRGNLQISNTAGQTNGIIFPDGTFQDTAAAYTPSFGYPGTMQFAGNANTFSGDSSHLFWDSGNTTLVASNLYINSNIQSYNYASGALQVLGGVGITGNLYVLGNIVGTGNTVIIGNTGVFFGDTQGFGALYGGIRTGYVYQPNTVLQLSANADDYAQLNLQNINPGSAASGDMVVTADNGTDNDGYIDLGINSSTFNQGTLDRANDGYLYVAGNTTIGGGNLILGTLANNDIIFSQGGANLSNEIARFAYAQGLVLRLTTPSFNHSTGALVTAGGLGVAGNINLGGSINAGGSLQVLQQAMVANLISNSTIQAPGSVTAGTVNSNGSILGNSLASNSTIQAPGSVTAGSINSNGAVQAAGITIAAALISNSKIQAAGTATVNSLVSNTTMQSAGTATVGALYSNTFAQISGTATANALVSNTSIGGQTLTIAAAATVNSLVANTTVFANSLLGNTAQFGYIYSNTFVQAAGQITAQTMVSNSTISANGLISAQQMRSNGFVEGATLKTTGLAQLAQLITNSEITANTLNIITDAVVQKLESNTTIQAAGAATVNTLFANLNVTSQNINALTKVSASNVTANAAMSTVDLTVAGIERITNTTPSTSTGSGALQVAGGVGILGNLNVGGQQAIFAGNVRINGNLLVQGNSTIINSNTISVLGPTIEVGSDSANNPPLSSDDGYDRGLLIHFFSNYDSHAFLGRQDSTGALVYITNVQPGVTNVINPFESVSGYYYGSTHFGSQLLSNTTVSTDTASGALVVSGGVGIGGDVNAGGNISAYGNMLAIGGLQAARIVSNSTISAAGQASVGALHSNTNVDATNISATNSISGLLIAANSSVTSNEITALDYITGNVLVGNLAIVTPNVQATNLITGQAIISNTTISAASLQVSDNVVVGSLTSNSSIQSAGPAIVNRLISNLTVQTQFFSGTSLQVSNSIVADNIVANSRVSATTVNASNAQVGSLNAGNIFTYNINVDNRAMVDSLQANSFVQAQIIIGNSQVIGNVLVANNEILSDGRLAAVDVYGNLLVQSAALLRGQTIVSNSTVSAAGTVSGQSMISNSDITAAGSIIAQNFFSNANITAGGAINSNSLATTGDISSAGRISANYLVANAAISAPNISISGVANFNVVIAQTSVTANTYVQANNLIANVSIGVGTTTPQYPLDVYGNIHVSNTATASGIVFSDGSFQGTAARNTPSYGALGTIQFAGNSNTFAGNTASFFWDDPSQRLGIRTNAPAHALDVRGNASIGGTLYVSQLIADVSAANSQITAGNLNIQNLAIVGQLISNSSIYATSFNSNGTVQANIVIANSYVTAASLTVSNSAIVGSLSSNSTIQSAGDGVFGSVTSNAAVQAAGIGLFQALTSNSTIQSAGDGVFGSVTSNSTIQSASDGVFGSVTSNSTIQSAGLLTAQSINSNSSVTANSFVGSGTAVFNQVISNTSVSAAEIYAANVIATSGTFNTFIVNTNITSSYLNITNTAVVGNLISNAAVSGNVWTLDGNLFSTNTTFQTVIDSWSTSLYRTAHYMIQISDGVNARYQSCQMMILQDGTNAYITEYNDVYTSISLGLFSADVIGGNLSLLFSPIASSLMTIKVVRTTISV